MNKITRGKKYFTLFIQFVFLLYFTGCKNHYEDGSTATFNSLYKELQNYNYAEYDSLMVFYNRVDSINDRESSALLKHLKKIIQSRLNYRTGNFDQSTRNLFESNTFIAHLPEADSLRASNYMSIGVNHMLTGVFDSAFYYFVRSEAIFDSLQNSSKLNAVYGNMAKAYYNMGNQLKAREYIDKVINDSANIPVALSMWHLKANISGSEGKIDSALLIDRDIIAQYGNGTYSYIISSFYNNMSMCFLSMGQIDSALYYCRKSYQADSIAGFEMNMGVNMVLLADIYHQSGNKIEADNYYNKALGLFSKGNNADKKVLVFEALAQNAQHAGDFKLLSQYKDSIFIAHQKINNIEINRTIEALNIEYESAKKNQQILEQKFQLKVQRAALYLIILITLLIVVVLYFIVQYRDKNNKLILVEQERKLLSMLMETEENERTRIARDLHDSVNQKLAVAQMSISLVEAQDYQKLSTVSDLLKDISTEVRTISRKLYPKDIDKGIIPALEYLCEQHNMLRDDIQLNLTIGSRKNNQSENRNVNLMLYRIVQEITNNALKHSKATCLAIFIACEKDQMKLEISDNGVGFDVNHPDSKSGVGLRSIFDRVGQMNGTVDLQSDSRQGTRFSIVIPC